MLLWLWGTAPSMGGGRSQSSSQVPGLWQRYVLCIPSAAQVPPAYVFVFSSALLIASGYRTSNCQRCQPALRTRSGSRRTSRPCRACTDSRMLAQACAACAMSATMTSKAAPVRRTTSGGQLPSPWTVLIARCCQLGSAASTNAAAAAINHPLLDLSCERRDGFTKRLPDLLWPNCRPADFTLWLDSFPAAQRATLPAPPPMPRFDPDILVEWWALVVHGHPWPSSCRASERVVEAKHSVVVASQQEQQFHSIKAGMSLLRKCLEHNSRPCYSAALCGEPPAHSAHCRRAAVAPPCTLLKPAGLWCPWQPYALHAGTCLTQSAGACRQGAPPAE